MKKLTSTVLALTMLAALAACGAKQSAAVTPTPAVTPAQTAAAVSAYPLLADSKSTVTADLNGDGKTDEIYADTTNAAPDGTPKITALKINGADYTDSLYNGTGFYSNNPDEARWALTDIDVSDGMLEIALMDYGPSDDDVTDFFRWDGTAVTYIGQVSGFLYTPSVKPDSPGYDVADITFAGDGTVHSYVRLSVLQTWFASCDYRLGADGRLAVVPQELYYPVGGKTYPVTAQKDVYVYAKNDLSAAKTVLKTGGTLTVTASDNAEWVLCKSAEGADCWLHLSNNGQMIDTPSGAQYSGDALDGLVFAD